MKSSVSCMQCVSLESTMTLDMLETGDYFIFSTPKSLSKHLCRRVDGGLDDEEVYYEDIKTSEVLLVRQPEERIVTLCDVSIEYRPRT